MLEFRAMKITLILGALFILVLGSGYYMANRDAVVTTDNTESETELVLKDDVSDSNLDTGETINTSGNNGSEPTITSYTLADVSIHKTASSCWTVISGEVYDLTTWIQRHPGGSAAILSLCGKDGTETFMKKHGEDDKPQAQLVSFKIGNLAQ